MLTVKELKQLLSEFDESHDNLPVLIHAGDVDRPEWDFIAVNRVYLATDKTTYGGLYALTENGYSPTLHSALIIDNEQI